MVHMRVPMENVVNTNGADAHKPQENHRGEQEPHPVCTVVLKRKQTYQNYTSSRYFYICTKKQRKKKGFRHNQNNIYYKIMTVTDYI